MTSEKDSESSVILDRLFSDQQFHKRKNRLEERIAHLMSLYPETNLTPKQQKSAQKQGNKEFPLGSLVKLSSLQNVFYGGIVQEIDNRGIIYVAAVWFPVVHGESRWEEYPAYKDHCFESNTGSDRVTTYTYSLKKIIPLHSKKAAEYGHPINDLSGDVFQPAKHPFEHLLTSGLPYLPTFKSNHGALWSNFGAGNWFDCILSKIKVDAEGLFTEEWSR